MQGLVIFTSLKAAFLGSFRFGSGLIIARLPDGSWSAPSAMAAGGIGAGGQVGVELTDFVFVLNTDEAVQKFSQSGSLTIGGNVSMALGPFGRSAEVGAITGHEGTATMFAYSKTRGLFGGATIEGGLLGERADANKKMYGRKISAKQLLTGEMSPPPEIEPLLRILNSDIFQSQSPSGIIPELPSEQPHERRAELPCQGPNEPPEGIPEVAADSSVGPELPAEPAQGPAELSTGNLHDSALELDSSQAEPIDPSQQVSEETSLPPEHSPPPPEQQDGSQAEDPSQQPSQPPPKTSEPAA